MNEEDTSLYGKNREGKVEALHENRMFIRNERYERRKHKITRISRPQ